MAEHEEDLDAVTEYEIGKLQIEKHKDNSRFIDSMASTAGFIEHNAETCGCCCHRKIWADVALEMRAKGDVGEGALERWTEETTKRWHESKFFKLWKEERKAGRDPEEAFKKLGWEA